MKATLVKDMKWPIIMGILNVTPDSFSDGGRFLDVESAVAHGLALIDEGADIIDVGGESTRPGSISVSEEEEKRRVLHVIERLARNTDAVISVDTVKSGVAEEALAAGASMVNDVSGLRRGSALAEVVAKWGANLVVMHSRGTPADMQVRTEYGDVVTDIKEALRESVAMAKRAGVADEKIWIDPGIGFAKTTKQNLTILHRLSEIVALGYPVLVGPSRKSFIGKIADAGIDDRLGGTAAAVAAAVIHGALAIRVHDVHVIRQAAMVARAIFMSGTNDRRYEEFADV